MRKMPFFNRELSWLEFNQRVLDEACDTSVPLLERLKFLAITASNLDEFFMVRVGGVQLLLESGARRRDPAGLTPVAILAAILKRVRTMMAQQYTCFMDSLEPMLRAEGIIRLRPEQFNEQQIQFLSVLFETEISGVCSPMRLDTTETLPTLANLQPYLLVRLAGRPEGSDPVYAVIPLTTTLKRFITVPVEKGSGYALIEDVVRLFLPRMFLGEHVEEAVVFRVTRNADVGLRDEFAADLVAEMQTVLTARKAGGCVRLEVESTISRQSLQFLRRLLRVGEEATFRVRGPVYLGDFMGRTGMEGFDHLRYEAWPPQASPLVDATESMFENIARRNLLLAHPFESFDPVVRLVQEAADDPDVLAIKQILYRTSRNSPIVAALRRAAEKGKTVTVLVELKARFDEARNIEWAVALEQAGVQVIYGVKGLKTHAKLCVVVRREAQGIVKYCHFGTGNYNEATARMYTDVSFLTCQPDYGRDATAFFNSITGYSQPPRYLKIQAAPITLKRTLLELIDGEAERCRQGQPAAIRAKMNALVDPDVIQALYRASQAGVEIDLSVRGVCCLVPGLKGVSENVRVISVVDRYLEHSRIFYFLHGGDRRLYIASADWMPRNLERRIELMIPIEDAPSRKRLMNLLDAAFRDDVKGRVLGPDGRYERAGGAGRRAVRSQELLYRQACEASDSARHLKRTRFEPHRKPDRD